MDSSWRRVGGRVLEFLVGGLFIYAGALKAWDPIGFAGDIENYHMLPWVVGAPLAVFLPWLEVACGVALIVRRAEHGALAILTALMLVFIAATIIAKARGIDISCGCFGHAVRNLSFASHLAIDFAILAAIGVIARREPKQL
jgi:putative oxidoreductase